MTNYRREYALARGYHIALLTIGVILIGFAFKEVFVIWTPKSGLTPLTGTLDTADLSTTTVEDRKGHASQKAELIFYLNEHKKKFSFVENVREDYSSNDLNAILKGLNKSNNITVWIDENDKSKVEPKVFQIDSDKTTILEFEKVRTKNRPLTAFMLLLGLGCIVSFIWIRYPETLKRVFN